MNKDDAIYLIRDTFENAFSKERFINFVKNLLNTFDDSKAFHVHGYVKEKYKQTAGIIKTYERLGTYTDLEEKKIDILIVYLQKDNAVDRARTTLRNFAADYLKQRNEKDAGLFAFVSPNGEDWRFSFVKMEYKFEKTEKGIIKAKEQFTPAKRYSFLVGPHEASHTAQSRMLPVILNDKTNPTLKDIEEIFNIEKVTKEFFEKYRNLFLQVKEALDEIVKKDEKIRLNFSQKQVNSVAFTKKLLGQIVFLYFLQKKGWFGVERDNDWGTGSKNFFRLLFEKMIVDYKNFFNDILEPLFYEALAKERDDNFYSRFNCKIPFLNGGLFDPISNYDWVHTDILLPNELFSNTYKTKEGDIGTGILDVFDRYNFTVKEDEPLEKEVAVDPEMLGKVFENLLEIKDRKSKGTYYTPREIVHYMCQESLINYLLAECEGKVSKKDVETLIKFGEIAIEHDSRVGLNGKETQTYSYKIPESVRKNADLVDEKLSTIKVCDPAIGSGAFPVGMMNEIIRTRNALTSYIKNKTGRTIYDFKRHAIQNCLYGVDIDPGAVEIAKLRLWLSLVVDEEDIKSIKPLPNLDYKIVCGNSLMSIEKNSLFTFQWFEELEKLKPLFFEETNANRKKDFKKQIDELIKQITNNNKDFDFEVYFSEVFHEKKGFDIVIANPPWVVLRHKEIGENTVKYLKANYVGACGFKMNLFPLFVELSIDLVKIQGIVTLIIPNRLLDTPSYRGVREKFIGKLKILDIENLPSGGFENIVAGNIILILQNRLPDSNKILVRNFYSKDVQQISTDQVLKNSNLTININQDPIATPIVHKIESVNGIKLKNICDIHVGIMIKNKQSKFVDDQTKGKNYKIVTGRDLFKHFIIKRHYFNLEDVEIFGGTKNPNKHLESPKLLVRKTGNIILCSIDDQGTFAEQSVYLVLLRNRNFDIKFLDAILNSKVSTFYFQNELITNPKSYPYIQHYDLEKILIPNISNNKQQPFIDIVDKIIKDSKSTIYLTNSKKQTMTKDYQKQIDQMVYKLYELTPGEIKIVEENTK